LDKNPGDLGVSIVCFRVLDDLLESVPDSLIVLNTNDYAASVRLVQYLGANYLEDYGIADPVGCLNGLVLSWCYLYLCYRQVIKCEKRLCLVLVQEVPVLVLGDLEKKISSILGSLIEVTSILHVCLYTCF